MTSSPDTVARSRALSAIRTAIADRVSNAGRGCDVRVRVLSVLADVREHPADGANLDAHQATVDEVLAALTSRVSSAGRGCDVYLAVMGVLDAMPPAAPEPTTARRR